MRKLLQIVAHIFLAPTPSRIVFSVPSAALQQKHPTILQIRPLPFLLTTDA
ncbi:hypothetical protein LDG_6078 [Legionella drancourtii LLAP12]|uniref:Uncharacterized protein n=1 Tax=Legionella drancourtii LLAP12 TaxID=658187 RepID=G9ELS7_9GAMM|nr:hypothetical protein LDG_6078 [Legionella drancourtii LLAP12]